MAELFSRHMPTFQTRRFVSSTVGKLPSLELKERVRLVADALHEMLPENTADRFRILEAVLHPDDENRENAESDSEGLCGWGVWPLTHLIGAYGLRDFEAFRSMKQ